jgi:hypothetical protein
MRGGRHNVGGGDDRHDSQFGGNEGVATNGTRRATHLILQHHARVVLRERFSHGRHRENVVNTSRGVVGGVGVCRVARVWLFVCTKRVLHAAWMRGKIGFTC